MEPGYLTVVLLLALQVGKGNRYCYQETYMNICEFPVFIHPLKENSLQITCKVGGIGILQKLGVGIKNNTEHVETAYKDYNVPPEYTNPRRREKFTPASPTNLSDTNTTMTLTLKPLNLLDLTKTWYCEVQYKIKGDIFPLFRQKKLVSLPYPVDTTFAAYPPKPSYSREEVVNLRCRGYSAMKFSKSTKLHVSFQRKQGNCWIYIDPNDTTQTEGIQTEDQILHGVFYRQLYILPLRVSSIVGCSRRYRCLLSYKTRSFEEEAVEHVINATTCVGKEPYIAVCHTTTTDVTLTTTTKANKAGKAAQPFSMTAHGLLIGVSCSAALLLIIFVLLLLLVRRRRKRKQKKSSIPHMLPISPEKVVVVGAGTPKAVHELPYLQFTPTPLSSNVSGTSFSSNPSETSLSSNPSGSSLASNPSGSSLASNPSGSSLASNPSGSSLASNPSQGSVTPSHIHQYTSERVSQVSEISDYTPHTIHH